MIARSLAASGLLSATLLAASAQEQKPQPSAGGIPDAVPFGQPYGAPIGLDAARRVVAAAEAEAAKRGWPMNIALVDTHGDLVHFSRMDGSQLVSVEVSQRKARTAARWRRETRVFFNSYASGSAYYGTLDPELAASPGGFPLVIDGKIVGAIGCSGGTGDQDTVVCQAGIAALM
ncbi:GlcG/HbpS family heme-binding protein [Methylorubrum zatmanii]|uniref:Heme-binding protein n=1 Tax=Methylorubrum zatmanii TaxID=29429 RepID=A0ABW1WV52_9HYPH|nr:heme-binding protein [Methylorubrum zatmanii]MBD8908860.1 hypothetical protein [Methylorubrum zatmanii]